MKYTKEDIKNLLNKNNALDANKLRKTELTVQQAYNIFYDVEQIPTCEGCQKELKFGSFISGYGTCRNRSCPLEKQKTKAKKVIGLSQKVEKEYTCHECGQVKMSKSNLKICPSCVKILNKEKILKLEPSTTEECITVITEFLDKNIKSDHWTETLQSKYPNVYVQLFNIKNERNLYSIPEVAYQLYYNVEAPGCKGCGIKIGFRSFTKGYGQFCPKPECQWKDEEQRELKLKNIAKTVNTKQLIEHEGKFSYYNPKYKNFKYANRKYGANKYYIPEFKELEDFDKEVPFLDFLEPEDFANRYWYYKNNLTEQKKCLHCGEPVKDVRNEYCSAECVYNSEIVKEKTKNTNLEKIGVEYPTQSKVVIQTREQNYINKYGVKHHMLVDDIVEGMKKRNLIRWGSEWYLSSPERTTFGYKNYHYTTPSGKEVYYQGYEIFLLQEMYEKFQEDDVIHDAVSVVYYDEFNAKRRYFPDLYIKSTDTLYEVKSEYTLKQSFIDNNLYHKIKAAVKEYSKLELIVYTAKGEIEYQVTITKENIEKMFKNILEKYK